MPLLLEMTSFLQFLAKCQSALMYILLTVLVVNLVLSAAQYSQVISIFDMFISCYETLSDQIKDNFITQHLELE